MPIKSINPTTGEVLAEYDLMQSDVIKAKVDLAHKMFMEWKESSLEMRQELLIKLASVLRNKKEDLAKQMVLEMGKPIGQARAEVEKSAWCAEVYAEKGKEWMKEKVLEADGMAHKVVFQPLGVILGIMPWNFPVWQVIRFAVPAIFMGNVALLKHSNVVPGCALELERVFLEAGFPEGVMSTLLADHKQVEMVISNPYVRGVSLTGSTEAGMKIAEIAGRYLKKVVLELGGSDPFIVLEDANLEKVAKNAVLGRTQNSGQSCIAAKRFVVHKSVADEFYRLATNELEKLKIGDPMKEDTDIGPLATENEYRRAAEQLRDAKKKGANIPDIPQFDTGYFVAPTFVMPATPDMKIVQEEVFAPFAPILTFESDEEAVKISNDTPYGLGASIWTEDLKRGENLARKIEAGTVFVNSIVKSDPRIPFGGIKASGIGRELSSYGLKEFANIKALNVYKS